MIYLHLADINEKEVDLEGGGRREQLNADLEVGGLEEQRLRGHARVFEVSQSESGLDGAE